MDQQIYFFPPHIGNKYGKDDGYFARGLKILAIGNSHHCDTHFDHNTRCNKNCCNYGGDCHKFTSDVVDAYIKSREGKYTREKWMRNFTKFARILGADGKEKELWESITFYNFLQSAVESGKAQGTPEEINQSKGLVMQCIRDLMPDIVIVWGKQNVFDNMPGTANNWVWEWNDDSDRCGTYTIDGKRIKVVCINHPQACGYEKGKDLISSIAPEIYE